MVRSPTGRSDGVVGIKRKEVAPKPNPRLHVTATLPNGKILGEDDEVTIKGVGRFRFMYGWGNDEATFWGPLNRGAPSWRTFKVDRVTTVHRKKAV